tara:strand:+ start:1154 stop:1804 length:651 start_codon:yes stop_codon:yes gene_type:complete
MSYLADVVLPEKEVEEVEVREIDDYVDEVEVEDDTGVEEEVEPLPPPPQKKDKLKTEDIFRPKPAPTKKVKVAPEPQEITEPIVPKITPVKKKRQLSEKQKEALRKGREARMKKKQVEPEPVYEAPKSEVEYKEKKMNEDYQRQHPVNNGGFSQDDIAEMIFQGVQRYDTIRKKRKEKKRATQAKQNQEKKVFNDLNSQLAAQRQTYDPWSAAFNF